MDQIDKIMAYEQGDLSEEDTISLFQELIDGGIVEAKKGLTNYNRIISN